MGSAILPGVGTIVGGLIGSVVAGAAAGKATEAILGNFIEDDADEMVRIIEKEFSRLAVDYLLNQKEAEEIVNKLSDALDGKKLKDMYASSDRKKFAEKLLMPVIEGTVKKRKYVKALTNAQMADGVKTVLEEIADLKAENGEEIVYA